MTTQVKIANVGTHPICVNVWETDSPRNEGSTVERHDLAPGESSPPITIWGWRRGVTIMEMDTTDVQDGKLPGGPVS